MNFQDRIKEVVSHGLSAPQPIVIDLADAVKDKEFSITGTSFYIIEAPDQASYISIKVNRQDALPIDWVWQTGFRSPFTKLYITTPAGQAGLMKIVIAAEEADVFEIIDNRSSISMAMLDILAELQGDIAPETIGTEKTVGTTPAVEVLAANADRKGAMVQAKDSNLGIIYIGLDNTVTTTKWVAQLSAGASLPIDDYRGPIFAIADTAAQRLGWGEW
jgi:hypothetical protein